MRTLLCLSAIFLLPLLALAQSDTIRWEDITEHMSATTCIPVDAAHPTVVAIGSGYSICDWVSRCWNLMIGDNGLGGCDGVGSCPSGVPPTVVQSSAWFDPVAGTMYYTLTSEISQCVPAMIDMCLASYTCELIDPAQGLPLSQCISINPLMGGILIGPFTLPTDYPSITFRPGCNGVGNCNTNCTIPNGIRCYVERDRISNYFAVRFSEFVEEPTYGCFCMTIDDILPVTLDHFSAIPGSGSIQLNWATASENNVDHFNVVRDGRMTAQMRAGNHATGGSYQWTDRAVVSGQLYHYQLVVVNLDGSADTLAAAEAAALSLNAVPDQIALYPAFPNPFNPTTEIDFDLPFAERVALKVFDLQGRQVATLVDGQTSAGHHRLQFNGSQLPSGVYLYQLQSAGQTLSGKMILLK